MNPLRSMLTPTYMFALGRPLPRWVQCCPARSRRSAALLIGATVREAVGSTS